MSAEQKSTMESRHKSAQESGPIFAPDKKLGRWFLGVSLLVAFLVVVGGIVRLTDSGLSIPEWPIINGSLLPPMSESDWEAVYKTYHSVIEGVEVDSAYHREAPGIIPIDRFKTMFALEYFHRFLAAVLGILFLVLIFKVYRRKEMRQRFGLRMWAGFALLILQAVMGGIVVKYDLQAEFLAIHLGLAFAFFGLLFWTGISISNPPDKSRSYYNKFLNRIGWTAITFTFLQVLSGGIVAGTKAGFNWNTWPKIGDHLIPPLNVLWRSYLGIMNFIHNEVLVQFIHRWWAFAVLIISFYIIFYSMKFHVSPRARIGLRFLASVVVLQVILGIITLLLKVPAALGVIHLGMGLVLFANLVYITYELKNHEVRIL